MLAETREPDWWDVPWNDGHNAVWLMHKLFGSFKPETFVNEEGDLSIRASEFVASWLSPDLLREARNGAEDYWRAEELLREQPTEPFRIVLRMIQLSISKSDGGGIAYNTLLRPVWDRLTPNVRYMELARCRDALGIEPSFDQSANDRQRRAFYIAWKRGLYRVAYAVGRAPLERSP